MPILGADLTPTYAMSAGVEMFKKNLSEGQAGENVGLLLRGVKREELLRGQVCMQFMHFASMLRNFVITQWITIARKPCVSE